MSVPGWIEKRPMRLADVFDRFRIWEISRSPKRQSKTRVDRGTTPTPSQERICRRRTGVR